MVGIGVGVAAVAGLAAGAAIAGPVMVAAGIAAASRRNAKPPLRPEDIKWDTEGRIENWSTLLKIIQQGGIAVELRSTLWPFLLGVFSPHSTATERSTELLRLRKLYTKLIFVCQELDVRIEASKKAQAASSARASARASGITAIGPPSPEKPPPLSNNLAAFAEAHRIIVLDAIRTDLRGCPLAPLAVMYDDGRSTMKSSSPHAGGAEGRREKSLLEKTSLSSKSSSSSLLSLSSSREHSGTAGIKGDVAVGVEHQQKLVTSASSLGATANAMAPTLSTTTATTTTTTTTTTTVVLPVSVGEGLPELMFVDPPQPEPSKAVACGHLPVWRSPLATATIGDAPHLPLPTRRSMMRLVNILSAYAVHDPENGYCQGMSDLAASFVQTIEDDAMAFACFERFMRAARKNFRHDETGIKKQLSRVARILADTDPVLYRRLQTLGSADCMFAYRMVLVMLRRELSMDETFILWEVKWALEYCGSGGSHHGISGVSSFTSSSSPPLSTTNSSQALTGTAPYQYSSSSAGIAATVSSMNAATKAAVAEAMAVPILTPSKRYNDGNGNGAQLLSTSFQQQQQQQKPPPPDFILQFVAAAVRSQRSKILHEAKESDDVLRLFNAIDIDFWTALAQARKQHKAYAQGIAVLERL